MEEEKEVGCKEPKKGDERCCICGKRFKGERPMKLPLGVQPSKTGVHYHKKECHRNCLRILASEKSTETSQSSEMEVRTHFATKKKFFFSKFRPETRHFCFKFLLHCGCCPLTLPPKIEISLSFI